MGLNVIVATILLAANLAVEPPLVRTLPIPGGQIPTEVKQHAGAVWFVSWRNWPKLEPYIGKITVRGTIHLNEVQPGTMPGLMTRANNGTLWITDRKYRGLWSVLPDGKIRKVRLDRPTLGIAQGADGGLWCTHPRSSVITNYAFDGSVKSRWDLRTRSRLEGPEKPSPAGPRPEWIVAGPDGGLWFNDPATSSIGRIGIDGEIRMHRLPKRWQKPGEVVLGGDGALWFNVRNQSLLGRITTDGTITSVKIHAPAVTLAPDLEGRIWYSESSGGAGYVNADGTTDHFAIAIDGEPGLLRSMAVGPDGSMWFADEKNRVLGRIELPLPKTP